MRTNALVSGGALPLSKRGTVEGAFIETADWLTTFCAIAGVDPTDERAAAAGLPPVTGVNLWPLISGANATRPRDVVLLGASATGNQADGETIVQGYINASSGLKILLGELAWSSWPGPLSPGDGGNVNKAQNCTPCLFDIINDESERNDLSTTLPNVAAEMLAHLATFNQGLFSPNRGKGDNKAACAASAAAGGFLAPFVA